MIVFTEGVCTPSVFQYPKILFANGAEMYRKGPGVCGDVLSPLSGLSWPVSPPAFFVFWHQLWQWVGCSVLLLVPPQCVPLKSTLNILDIPLV